MQSKTAHSAKRNLILSGGPAHDYTITSPLLAQVLESVEIQSEIREDFDILATESLHTFDMITLNCVRWTCSQDQVSSEWRENWAFALSEAARENILKFLSHGKGLLALHAATICFDDWPVYRDILGAWWEWGTSGHAPVQNHRMEIRNNSHPIAEGISDFTIKDELYTHARFTDSVSPLIEGTWEGQTHPMLWIRDYGEARICYNALGHGPEAFEHPGNQLLLQRGSRWVLKQLG